MDQSYISSIYKKTFSRDTFWKSNIVRLFSLLLLFLIYFFLISPYVEKGISKYMLNELRSSRILTLNYLTPLNTPAIYANVYNLNTLSTSKNREVEAGNTDIKSEDPRVIAMQKFLLDYNSPLYQSSKMIVEEADKFGLDWRLVVAVSGVESAFCKTIPRGTYNGWGWRGINKTADGWSQFNSWDHGVSIVTSGLAIGYGVRLTPFQIEPYYCPPCAASPAHAWANGVTRYMRELKYYLDNLN